MPYFPTSKQAKERKAFGRKRWGDNPLYNTQRWRKDRAAHLSQPTYYRGEWYPVTLCVKCLERGRVEIATVSDHIVPISQGGDVWDWANRQGLCPTCHNQKSGGEAHVVKGST